MDSQKIQVYIHHGGHFEHKVYVPKLCDPSEVLKEVLESVRREGEGKGSLTPITLRNDGLLTYKESERNIPVEASTEQVTGEEGAKKKMRFKSPAKKRSKRPKKIVINTPSENPKTTNVFSSYQLRSGRQLNKDVCGSKKMISSASKSKGKERIGESERLSESKGVGESQGAGHGKVTVTGKSKTKGKGKSKGASSETESLNHESDGLSWHSEELRSIASCKS